LPKIGEGLGEWSEAPSYEEGVGVDGKFAGFACRKRVLGGTQHPDRNLSLVRVE